jgi:hypothetical protein
VGRVWAAWKDFGDVEAQHLAAIVHDAQRGDLSAELYKARLDALVRKAA